MKSIKRQLILFSVLLFMAFICCGAVSAVQYADVAVNSIDCAVFSDGSTAEFSINIENKGSIAAQNVVLRDKMAGVDVSQSQYSINNGPWQDWNKNYINLGTMGAGSTMLIEFKAPITSNTLVNKAELTTTTPEFNRYNNRLTYTTQATYTIISSAGTGGTVNPNGNVYVVKGYDQTFNITPDTGYTISDVTVDGSSVGAVTNYTFNNVQANHTINATFNTTTHTYAYITNGGGNNVSVIDTSTNTVIATIPVGSYPWGVAVSPDGTRAYVTNANNNNVSVINTATNTVTAIIGVGSYPRGVVVSPNGTRAYVTNPWSDNVSVINTATNTVIASIGVGDYPTFVAVSPDGTRAYVTNQFSSSVSVIDTTSNTVFAIIGVGSYPWGVAVNPDGTRVYVTNNHSINVSVIDTTTNTVIATIPVGSDPMGVAVSPDGTRLYITNQVISSVSVIDTSTNTVIATIGVGSYPRGVAVSPDGTRVYVTNTGSGTVSVIDTTTNNVIDTIPVGSNPECVAVTPDMGPV